MNGKLKLIQELARLCALLDDTGRDSSEVYRTMQAFMWRLRWEEA